MRVLLDENLLYETTMTFPLYTLRSAPIPRDSKQLGLGKRDLSPGYRHIAPLGLNALMHCITFQTLFSILKILIQTIKMHFQINRYNSLLASTARLAIIWHLC